MFFITTHITTIFKIILFVFFQSSTLGSFEKKSLKTWNFVFLPRMFFFNFLIEVGTHFKLVTSLYWKRCWVILKNLKFHFFQISIKKMFIILSASQFCLEVSFLSFFPHITHPPSLLFFPMLLHRPCSGHQQQRRGENCHPHPPRSKLDEPTHPAMQPASDTAMQCLGALKRNNTHCKKNISKLEQNHCFK